ncbi:MAG: glycosyltransferase family 39 protein [Pseudomonadota bacterium]
MSGRREKIIRILFYAACTIVMLIMLRFCLHQIASYWQWGHNGYNGAAYQVAARNSIRHHVIWPVQYHTADTEPKPSDYYTHAPLGLHALTTLSVFVFGDSELQVRLVPAVFTFLSALMLLVFLAKHYSRPLALVGTLIYVLLPITTIYGNMTNHSTGCIFFALLMFDGYLEWDRRKRNIFLIQAAVGFLGTTFMDWPGYTLSGCLAIAAFYRGMKPDPLKGYTLNRQVRFALVLMLVTALSFKGFLDWITGVRGIDDVLGAITSRSESTNIITAIKGLYGTVINDVFPKSVRYPALAWLIIAFIRHAAGKFRPADLVPASFFTAGMVQFVIFPNASALHHYWNWQFNPFVAIACAQVLMWIVQGGMWLARLAGPGWMRTSMSILAWTLPLLLFFSMYYPRAMRIFRQGRAVAGAFHVPDYDREYKKILFAQLVSNSTGPHDGVAIHDSLEHRIEFESYLDRQWSGVTDSHLGEVEKYLDKKRKWVLIGDRDKANKTLLVQYMTAHPYVQVDSYFFIDLRKQGEAVTAYTFKPMRPPLGWRFFVTPYDPPCELVRSKVFEERIKKELIEARSKGVGRKTKNLKHFSPKMTPKGLLPSINKMSQKR